MKSINKFISYFFIGVLCLIFIYTGVDKLVNSLSFALALYKNSLFSDELTYYLLHLIPSIEIITAVLLLSRFRLVGSIASFILLIMFTIYNIILYSNYGDSYCGCANLFEFMTFKEHLVFNIILILMSISLMSIEIRAVLTKSSTQIIENDNQ